MFGFLALGIFASLAFANAEGGGKSGGFLSGLLGGKTVSDFMKDKMADKKEKDKEKKEAIEKKEQELKDLCKKDKKDLTPRDIKRMKELQKEVDVEEFLTNKELKSFADATGYTPKRDVSNIDADDDLTPEDKQKEIKSILKKKPGELTPKDKARLKKLASDPDLDREDFSEDELKKFSDATGENLGEKPKEDPKNEDSKDEDPKQQEAEELENEQNKAIAIAKEQYEKALEDPEKNKDFIEAYETFQTCAYDEDGKLRSPEEVEAEFKKLPKEKQEALRKGIKEAADSKEAQEAYNEESSKISNEQAKEAAQEVGKDRKKKSSAKKNEDEMKKYADFKFEDGLEPADLDSEDPNKKKRAQEQLEKAGLDPAVYKAVQKAKADKTVDGKEPSIEDIAADDDVQNTIKDYNKRKKEGDKGGKKEGDDKDTNDDETEEETKNSEFDDGEPDDEAEGEEDKKKQNPHKVWKQKSYKRGDKTFKTKSYYNKKGASISKEEFQEKVKNYEKNNKKTAEESISDYLQDRLVLERFYPEDITMSKQFEGLDLSAFIKSRIEVED